MAVLNKTVWFMTVCQTGAKRKSIPLLWWYAPFILPSNKCRKQPINSLVKQQKGLNFETISMLLKYLHEQSQYLPPQIRMQVIKSHPEIRTTPSPKLRYHLSGEGILIIIVATQQRATSIMSLRFFVYLFSYLYPLFLLIKYQCVHRLMPCSYF